LNQALERGGELFVLVVQHLAVQALHPEIFAVHNGGAPRFVTDVQKRDASEDIAVT
jgi:hypothetical protein